MNAPHLLPPLWLIHVSIAAVWLYEGLWCKLLNSEPNQLRIIEALPRSSPTAARALLKLLGVIEVAIAIWALTGIEPIFCATAQTALVAALNAGGIFCAGGIIYDPAGMVIKNSAFLVLVWVSASFPGWR
jgi:hypothetical protein